MVSSIEGTNVGLSQKVMKNKIDDLEEKPYPKIDN